MKPLAAALALSLLCSVAAAAAAPKGPPPCAPPPHCTPAPAAHRISVPAHALSYGLPATTFSLQSRGLRWDSTAGTVTLTMRRPLDYGGGDITLTVFHEVLGDGSGDIVFIVTPVWFNHGNSFETYGGELTELLAAPGSPTILYQQSAVLHAGGEGYQWPPGGEWWYFEIRREGSYTGPLQLMAVSVDY